MSLNLSQIFITSDSSDLPDLLKYSTNTAKDCFKECAYRLFRNDSLREFIAGYFDTRVLKAYDMLNPYSYKADLGKYCIAYQIGGWYADVSLRFIKTMNSKKISENADIELIYFNDVGNGFNPRRLSYAVAPSLFYSRPKLEVFEKSINQIVDNCNNRYYGISPLCPTGPGVFGSCIAANRRTNKHVVGDFMPLTPLHKNMNRCYILPDGDIVAQHKNAWFNEARAGDLSLMGASKTNNYIKMYNERSVYRDNEYSQ